MSKKKSEIAILLAKIDALAAEVKSLREQTSKIQVVHNHYHYSFPREYGHFSPPSYPYQPWITCCDSTARPTPADELITNA